MPDTYTVTIRNLSFNQALQIYAEQIGLTQRDMQNASPGFSFGPAHTVHRYGVDSIDGVQPYVECKPDN